MAKSPYISSRADKVADALKAAGYNRRNPAPIMQVRKMPGVGNGLMQELQRRGVVADGKYPGLSRKGTRLLIFLELPNRKAVLAAINNGELLPEGEYRGQEWKTHWRAAFAEVFQWAGKGRMVPPLPKPDHNYRDLFKRGWFVVSAAVRKEAIATLAKSKDPRNRLAARRLRDLGNLSWSEEQS